MITFENFAFRYGSNPVFENVNTTLTPGHICGILGRNGTGKSTLLYNIAGLLYPTSGSIRVNGFDPSRREAKFLEDIFMVPEEFYLPNISIRALLKYYGAFYPKFDPRQFQEYIETFEIPSGSRLRGMSYGQKKKLFIAFGVAANTSILLMDEPTNGLDILGKVQLRKIIARAASAERTILISSHQIKDLENLIDVLLVINDREILLNEEMDSLARKLTFEISFDEVDLADVLYAERLLTGNAIVSRNLSQEESKVDLELLYKATLADPAKMKATLNVMKETV